MKQGGNCGCSNFFTYSCNTWYHLVIELEMVGICRLCATISKSSLFVVLSRTENTVCQQLSDCCNIKIDMEDLLPKTVCGECLLELEAAHAFYKKVHIAQESFRKLFCIKINDLSYQAQETPTNSLEKYDELQQNDSLYIEDAEEISHSSEISLIADLSEETLSEAALEQESLSKDIEVKNWYNYSWMCFICAESCNSYKQLVQHAEQMHELQETEILFRCADCHKSFSRYFIFLNHVRLRHYESLALCCDICNIMCANLTALAQHRKLCGNKQQHSYVAICQKCGKAFQNDKGQKLHERLQHSNLAVKHTCQQCGKQFQRAFTLRIHERVHAEAKHFNCKICGHAFRQKGNLLTHMQAHSENKQYECVICKKCFKTNKNLDKHLLTHTNIKQFKCQYCEKSFRTNDARISHERIHTGEMPFKCNYCDKRSRFRSTHLSHLKLHTGECPYECVACDHKFRNWSNYNKHMKRKHALKANTTGE